MMLQVFLSTGRSIRAARSTATAQNSGSAGVLRNAAELDVPEGY